MSLETLFRDSTRRNPEKTAVICKQQRISYRELNNRTSMAAAMLQEILQQPQKKVLLFAHNSIRSLEVMFGCFRSNLIACPVNWRLSAYEVASIFAQEQFELVFFDKATQQTLQAALELSGMTMKQIELGGEEYEARLARVSREPEPETIRAPGDISIQYFTSGTTGTPKGVLLPDESLETYVKTYSALSEWTEDAIYQTSANLFHLSGFSAITCLCIGATLVLMDQFKMDEFLETMVSEGVTRVSMVPTIINTILNDSKFEKYDFSLVRKIIYGGAPMLPEQIRNVRQKLSCDTENAYGCTETCNISALTREDHRQILDGTLPEKKLASVGRPAPGVSIRIRGLDGQDVPPNTIGEITVKSPMLYKGYSHFSVPKALSEEGYHNTGDLGYVDEDGYIYIVDRKHDMIVCGGENIYPKEIEICISKMADAVSQVSVVGQADPIWGEIAVAFVVAKPGADVTAEQIIAFCKHHIASYKKPKRVIFVEKLPTNANGKVDKPALRRYLQETT